MATLFKLATEYFNQNWLLTTSIETDYWLLQSQLTIVTTLIQTDNWLLRSKLTTDYFNPNWLLTTSIQTDNWLLQSKLTTDYFNRMVRPTRSYPTLVIIFLPPYIWIYCKSFKELCRRKVPLGEEERIFRSIKCRVGSPPSPPPFPIHIFKKEEKWISLNLGEPGDIAGIIPDQVLSYNPRRFH